MQDLETSGLTSLSIQRWSVQTSDGVMCKEGEAEKILPSCRWSSTHVRPGMVNTPGSFTLVVETYYFDPGDNEVLTACIVFITLYT